MLAGVIFDFDGVIVDSHAVHLQAWKAFFSSVDKQIADADLLFVLEGTKRDEILWHFLGELTPEQIKLYGAEKDKLFQTRASEQKLVKGFTGFLEQVEAAGLPAVIATSGGRVRVESTLDRFKLRQRFHAIVTGDDVANGKPAPDLFYLAARSLHVKAGNILVCEDAVSGVIAAKIAKMKCLAIASKGREAKLREAGADLIVADFTQAKLSDVSKLFVEA
jgi:HAD superfamily hydrolase (TIGR01509 family)